MNTNITNIETLENKINNLNQKVDLLLEYVNEQRKKQQVWEDLREDLYRVGKESFQSVVKELDDRGIEVDMDNVKLLIYRLLQSIETFNTLLNMLQSLNDFIKDASPIAKEIIIDLTYKLDKLEQNGVFESFKIIFNNLTNPEFLRALANISSVLTQVKPDEKIDNKSLLKILKELNSKEVRQNISYGIRLVKEISKTK
jgi:CxxC motif-containing protein